MTEYAREFCEPQYNQGLNVPDKPAILARRREISQRVRERIAGDLDIAYGASDKEKLDVYPGARGGPVVVFIHGGYWQRYDKAEVAFLAEPLTQSGYTLAAINYDLCPAVTLDTIVGEVRSACAWTYRNIAAYGADPRRIIVCGNSAGGHLTAMMMATAWPEIAPDLPADMIAGGLAISGIYDLEPLRYTSLNDAIGLDAAAARRLSPVHYARATAAPLHIAVGEEESAEFHRQTRLLAELWQAPAHIVPRRHHFNLLLEFAEPDSVLLDLLKRCAGAHSAGGGFKAA